MLRHCSPNIHFTMSALQLCVALLYLAVGMASGCAPLPGADETCCPGLGCFSNEKPWRSMARPIPAVDCPDVVRMYFLLFTRDNPKVAFNITSWPNFTLDGSHFDASRQTVFFTHGWTAKTNDSSVYQLKDATLSSNDTNVILVDWSASSHANYLQAVSNMRVVAAQIESLIRFMMEEYGLQPENVKLIGHSLGAQASAYVGQSIPHIGWITGLDPAGPLFQGYSKEVQLSSDDADYVDVIHTDILLQFPVIGFGESTPTGHKDFYFNKGYHQPGCFTEASKKALQHFWTSFSPTKDIMRYLVCSHDRSIFYYSDAFRYRNCTYWGQKDATQGNVCTIDTCAPFGPCSKNFPARGSFLTITKGTAPYCDPNVKVGKQLAAIYNSCIKTALPANYQQGVLSEQVPATQTY